MRIRNKGVFVKLYGLEPMWMVAKHQIRTEVYSQMSQLALAGIRLAAILIPPVEEMRQASYELRDLTRTAAVPEFNE